MQDEYRLNVGLMIVNEQGLVWMGKRKNVAGTEHAYQMPQGGIDEGENPKEAAYRELFEETGLTQDHVELIKESDCWYQYDIPKNMGFFPRFKGQRQKWFLFRFKGKDADFNLEVHPEEIEFSGFIWTDISKIADMVISFKQDVYQKVVNEFRPYI